MAKCWRTGSLASTASKRVRVLSSCTYSVGVPVKTRHNDVEREEDADAVEDEGQIDCVALVLWTAQLILVLLLPREALCLEFLVGA